MAHIPVLLEEVCSALELNPGELFIDGTGGSGGHAQALLERIGERGKLLILDWDPEAAKRLTEKFARDPRVIVVEANFATLREVLKDIGWAAAHKLLLDLGFSSEHLESSGRGFSFRRDEPLTMTYSPNATPVKTLLKELSEEDLAEIVHEYGEERYAKRIARCIRDRMRRRPIETNSELENVRRALHDLDGILLPGGRAAVISFHSLEDRIVKEEFRLLAREKDWKLLTKKPITAGRRAHLRNPRAPSAKLRPLQQPGK